MKKIAFKIAFTPEVGSGHMYRCARLSAALKKKGVITYFLSNKKIKKKFLFLSKSFTFCVVKKNLKAEIEFLKSKNINNLLVDDPKFSLNNQKKYKSFVNKLFIYQDLPTKNIADVLVNHNHLKKVIKVYKKISQTKCRFYLGSKYYLFDQYRNLSKKRNLVSIFLGGNTPRSLLEKILKIINNSNLKKFKLVIFTGIFNKDITFLKKKYSSLKIEFKIQEKQKIFFDTISKSKIFFSSGGSTIIESIFLKTPTITFLRAKNQQNNCLNLSNDKLVYFYKKNDKIINFINVLLNDKKFLKKFVNRLDNFKRKNFKNKLSSKIFKEIK